MRWPWPVAVVASGMTGVLVLAAIVLAALEPTGTTLALAAVGGVGGRVVGGLGLVVARRDRAERRRRAARARRARRSRSPPRARSAARARRSIRTRSPRSTGWSRCWPRARSGSSSRSPCCSCTSPTAGSRAPRWRSVPAGAARRGLRPPRVRRGRLRRRSSRRSSTSPTRSARRRSRSSCVACIADLALLALLVACAASLVVRYRRAGRAPPAPAEVAGAGRRRRPGLHRGLPDRGARPRAGRVARASPSASRRVVGIPVAIAIAMLRHDLYDVDKALATTVGYGLIRRAAGHLRLRVLRRRPAARARLDGGRGRRDGAERRGAVAAAARAAAPRRPAPVSAARSPRSKRSPTCSATIHAGDGAARSSSPSACASRCAIPGCGSAT